MRAGARRGVSFATRGGSGSGTLGSAAAPQVAFLDIPSVRPVHVRFNGLRAKPLRGGCVGRDGNGDVGVCDRQLDYGYARHSGDGSALNRRPAILRLRTLEDFGNAEQDGLARNTGHDLQTDWQFRTGKTAGNGNGWHTGQICRAVVAQQQSTSRIFVRPDANLFLI